MDIDLLSRGARADITPTTHLGRDHLPDGTIGPPCQRQHAPRRWLRAGVATLFFALGPANVLSTALAQTRPHPDLALATIEELMNIEITSAARKEQRVNEVPAAVYVITRDDIRRSGMTSIPDLLRMVPGVQVAQVNANKWAVAVRGFNSLFSNKVLVLVDGRSIYNPLFSAVLWDTEDVMLEDVERIEVIRGPGAAIWGANAVNGVINIVTRPAADTSGLLVRASTGTLDPASLAIRYGGGAGTGAYRVYAQVSNHGDSVYANGTDADDRWRSVSTGFRGDWPAGAEHFMLQGTVTVGEQRPLWMNLDPAAVSQPDAGVSTTEVGSVLGRWTHKRADGSTLQLQSFADLAHRRESVGEYHRGTFDVAADYHLQWGARHDIVVGGGYRYVAESIEDGVGQALNPKSARNNTVSAFVQDEIALAGPRLKLTLGAKFEHDRYAGSGVQPTARLWWNVAPGHHAWAAVSRALRTPSLLDRGLRVDFPAAIPAPAPGAPVPDVPVAVATTVLGNPALDNERLLSSEAGYRFDLRSRASIDVTGFIGRYTGLRTNEPSTPILTMVDGRPVVLVTTTFANLLEADTRGIEITGRVIVNSLLQIDGTVSTFDLTPRLDPASVDPIAPLFDGGAPAYQWRAHAAFTLGRRGQADFHVFRVGTLGADGVPAYTRADARFQWTLTSRLTATALGQNLFDSSHLENAGDTTIMSTRVPRSGTVRLTWLF